MSEMDLSVMDPTMDLGDKVLRLLAEGYAGDQIAVICEVDPARALEALTAYAARVLVGPVPSHRSPECCASSYDGWCYAHGVFHPAGGS